MVHMKNPADTRKPYGGLSRSLVIAIDVGTTFSGVSYAILEPGEIPKIHGVTRFPGQEHVAGNSKIPSIIYYDKHGNVMAAGAEAENSSVIAQAEDEGWIKTELFKLRLRPRTMQLNMNGMRLSPLPKRKSPVHVFGDYLAYLYRCTRSFITDTHANGTSLWNAVESDIQFVLSHPNGWEGPQQTRMRNAAVYGNLVPDTDAGKARIRFVTEGEASLHACVLSGLANDVLSNPSKHGFLIADAGGGTLDISSYAIRGTAPLVMEEIAPPDCIFAGSVFVSRRAREFFQEKLKDSKYGTPDAVDHITRRFDETTKRLFRDRGEMQFVPFGSPLDKDSSVGIRNGQLKLSGNEVANLFEPSVDAAVNAIKAQVQASNSTIKSVFLVGGYAASPWLFTQLQERLAPYKITVSRPDTQTSKAVADGAVGFYCDHHVSARMSKFMYGVEFLRELDPNNPDHERRKERLCELPSGPKLLPDAFDCILARSVKVKESMVFTRKYCTELTNLSMLSVFEVEVWCFRGGDVVPEWINRQDDNFSTLCVVQADLSLLSGSAEPKQGKNGKTYWTIVFSVEIHFGLTEFKARMKWKDKDQIKFGPAVIVYNERGHRIEDDDIDVYPEDDVSSQNHSRSNPIGRSSSRPHTPVDSYYPPSSSHSRRASNAVIPDVTRIDTRTVELSKGYTPSVAPSAKSATYRGSDSERKKGKGRYIEDEKDRDRGMPAEPIERTTSTGLVSSPIAKIGSIHSVVGGEMSSNWNPPPASASSTKPQSRAQSIYGDGEHNPEQELQRPQSVVDEQNNPPPISPRSAALDAILDRPRSSFGDRSRTHTPFGGSRPRTPITHEPLVSARTSNTPGITRSNTPFIDRPKSGTEGSFFDRPKSAFGGGSIYGDSGPAMFGDSGPAADIGADAGTSLFGDPPASVFGDALAGESGRVNDNWGATGGEEAMDSWGATAGGEVNDNWSGGAGHEGGDAFERGDNGGNMPIDITPVAEEPVVTTPTTKKEKKKRKNSNTLSAPASGMASRASPSLSAKKSPFENTADTGFLDDPATGTRSLSPAIQGGGLWGSKAPSPKPLSPLNPASQIDNDPPAAGQEEFNWGFETTGAAGSKAPSSKPLSPLNPASQITNDPPAAGQEEFNWGFETTGAAGSIAPSPLNPVSQIINDPPATGQEEFNWGFDTPGGTGAAVTGDETGTDWNNVNLGEDHTKPPTRVPSPIPSAAVEKDPVATVKGKKKKKGSSATTPVKSPHIPAQEVAEKEKEEKVRAEKAEQERMAELDRLANEEAVRLQEEEAEKARLAAEANRLAEEAAEADRIAKEEAEKERLAAEADSLAAEETEKERLAAEADRVAKEAEKERLAEADRLATEEAAELQAQEVEKARLAEAAETELQEEREKAEKERAEQERLAEEDKDKVTAPVSAFGFGSSGLFSGGGDDTWGIPDGNSQKKKSKLGTQTLGPGSTWGFGDGSYFGSTAKTPLAEGLSSSQDGTGFSFSSPIPNLSLGFEDPNPKSRAASPVPVPVDEPNQEIEEKPTDGDVVSPTAENDATVEEETTVTSKKKKKKGKGNNVAAVVETEEPASAALDLEDLLGAENDATMEDPESFEPTVTSSKKKKKKNKNDNGAEADAPIEKAETPVLEEEFGNETPVAETADTTAQTGGGGGGGKKNRKGGKKR